MRASVCVRVCVCVSVCVWLCVCERDSVCVLCGMLSGVRMQCAQGVKVSQCGHSVRHAERQGQ